MLRPDVIPAIITFYSERSNHVKTIISLCLAAVANQPFCCAISNGGRADRSREQVSVGFNIGHDGCAKTGL